MNTIVYLFQVSACMSLFYGFYYLMLRRLTFFTINRWYLVVTLGISFMIPLLTITVRTDSVPIIQEAVYVNQLQTFKTQQPLNIASKQIVEPSINWLDVLKAIYLLAVGGLFVKLIVMLTSFFANVKSRKSTKIGNVHILHGDKKLNNGSFLNYIFLNDDGLSTDEIQQIIAHEMLHIKLLHSVDRILVKIVQIILWFNPLVYLYARAIEENHEFEVDREIGLSNDKSKYADMLLHLSVARQGMLYNSFSVVPLKKRITMLFTKPTNHMKRVIYLLALPVVMLSCLAFARLKNDEPTEKYSVIAGVELSDNIIKVLIDGKSYDNDVLYNISGSCIKSVSVKPVDPTKIINGKWVDVTVNILTKNGKIVYMTPMEKENLVKERHARPTTGFYNRVRLIDNNGKPFDKAIVNTLTGSVDVTVKPEDKIGFVVDGVFYNENDIRFINPKKSHDITVNSEISVRNVKPGEYAKGFASVFTITTMPAVKKAPIPAPPVKPGGSAQPLKKQTGTVQPFPVAPITQEEKQGLTKLMATQDQFYTRTHMVYNDKPPHDKITFKYTGGSASANLGVDDIAGAFIDGEFFDEDALKKITPEKAAKLEPTHEGFNPKKIPHGPYAVPFCFKTKTTQVIQQPPAAIPATPIKAFLLTKPTATNQGIRKEEQPFFSRTHIEDSEGKHDKITFTLSDQSISTKIDPDVKTGAFIDGVFYKETELNTLASSKIAGLAQSHGMLDIRKIPAGYRTSFSFRTKNSKGEVEEEVVSTKDMSQEDIDRLNRELIAREVLKRSHYPQFYNRIKFNAVDGKDYDYVVCTIGKGIVSAPVKPDVKPGLLIDGIFYDEEAVKKLPESKTKGLEMWYEGLEGKKVPKGYMAALSLRTKKTDQ